ncbi:KilA-N domain-containing protein [Deefgea piscis]|uniref:KilA-N domain-containing protein n=1 Tax=Deefgea piscis TaxID=2739061 RepID=UPI001C7ED8B4|nr:KilA-N domain-containing protein [Deefgea piscis]QZA82556.1 KilA-N domain-containing protein [Deefgea piscis]
MKNKIITADFNNALFQFTKDGWFNATDAAERFGKRPNDWLSLDETTNYIEALNSFSNTSQNGNWIKTRRGNNGGTWLHPKLAIRFAQWLDVRFAVWCDSQIDALIHGKFAPDDLAESRQYAASAYRLMCRVLQMMRAKEGKLTEPHHYCNESKIIGFAMTGCSTTINRDAISCKSELSLLAEVQFCNADLIVQGWSYSERKSELLNLVAVHRSANALASIAA